MILARDPLDGVHSVTVLVEVVGLDIEGVGVNIGIEVITVPVQGAEAVAVPGHRAAHTQC